jgi:acetyl esterase/lipase
MTVPIDEDLATAASQSGDGGPQEFDEAAVKEAIRDFGAQFGPDVLQSTRALYRPGANGLAWSQRRVLKDLEYGPAERNRLDFFPADRSGAPVLLFLHGGGFVGGDKSGDPVFYSNVGRFFAQHGFNAALANYRLAPAAHWPSGIEDVAAVIDWIAQHALGFGADPGRIVLVGQSAGAAHIANYLFNEDARSIKDTICGAELMSGFYRAKTSMVAGARAYFGDQDAQWVVRSPATHVRRPHPPIMLSVAEFDPAEIAEQTLDLAAVLNEVDGQPPQLIWFGGHNHVSTVHGLGLGTDEVGQALLDFASRVTRSSEPGSTAGS